MTALWSAGDVVRFALWALGAWVVGGLGVAFLFGKMARARGGVDVLPEYPVRAEDAPPSGGLSPKVGSP